MKKKGNKSDFTEERNRELKAKFFAQDAYSTSDDNLNKVLKSPASRFWVDPDRARDMMSRMEKDPQAVGNMKRERQRMYTALHEKYRHIRTRFPDRSRIQCVTMAVYSGAPEFYIAPSTARAILYKSLSSYPQNF